MADFLPKLESTSSFIKTADELLNISVSRERQRFAALREDISRLNEGNVLDAAAGLGDIAQQVANNLGLGPKAVGPISELPLVQQVSQNTELRFVKTKGEYRKDVAKALRKTATKSGWGKFNPSTDSISLGLGKITQYADDVENRYGPSEAGMTIYRNSDDFDQFDVANKFFPFRIDNLGTGKFEIFPAYIRNINEQFNATWGGRSYYGRSEEVYVYNQTSRSANLDFILFATSDELPANLTLADITGNDDSGYEMPVSNKTEGLALVNNAITKTAFWKKLSFLESLCYPTYDSDDRYASSPFGRINMGHLWEDQLCIIESINISYDPLVWDINGQHFTPMFASITVAIKLIHESSPGTAADGTFGFSGDTGESRFIHRTDFS